MKFKSKDSDEMTKSEQHKKEQKHKKQKRVSASRLFKRAFKRDELEYCIILFFVCKVGQIFQYKKTKTRMLFFFMSTFTINIF